MRQLCKSRPVSQRELMQLLKSLWKQRGVDAGQRQRRKCESLFAKITSDETDSVEVGDSKGTR